VWQLEDVLIGIHAAIQDLVCKDRDHEGNRKEETLVYRRRFIVGASLGGFLALRYAL
jgi:alpha-beta hydrolase superfamily lysophospholipase